MASLNRLFHDHGFGGQEQRSDGCGVLKRGTGHLGGINHTSLDEVLVLTGGRIETFGCILKRLNLLDHDATIEAGVLSDLLDRSNDSVGNNARASCLIALKRRR